MGSSSQGGKVIVGHPVDVASGTLFSLRTDIFLAGKMNLIWERRYSTSLLARNPSILGPGWWLPFLATFRKSSEGYHFIGSEGSEEIFADPEGRLEQGETLQHFGTCLELAQREDHYVVSSWGYGPDDNLRQYVFRRRGIGEWSPLERIEGPTGQRLEFNYDKTGKLVHIGQRREKRGLSLVYNDRGLVEAVEFQPATGPAQVAARYLYDPLGRLVAVSNALGHGDSYEYDGQNRVVREVHRGGSAFTFRYDDQGRCVFTSGPDGYAARKLHYLEKLGWTRVTDTRGNMWSYQWLPTGQVIRVVSPTGDETLTDFDEYCRVAVITSANGSVRNFSYDRLGNRSEVSDGLGRVSRFEYNERHQLTRVTAKDGTVWKRSYDSRGHLSATEDPQGCRWRFFWNERGDLTRIQNPSGSLLDYTYDNFGNMVEATDWLGNKYQLTCDEYGRRIKIVDPPGAETSYERDVLGHVMAVRWPDRSITSNRYDAAGQLIQTTQPGNRITKYHFGSCGRLQEVVNPLGHRQQYCWGREIDELNAIVNEKGESYSFEYNIEGRLVKTVAFDGRKRSFSYHRGGLLKEITNSLEEVTKYEWDLAGQLLGLSCSDGTGMRFEYDPMGRVVGAENDACNLRFERDVLGRLRKEIQGDYTVESEYNSLGDRALRRTTLESTTRYEYDANRRVSTIQLENQRPIAFRRDACQREIQRLFPGMLRWNQHYNSMGNVIRQWLSDGNSPLSGQLRSGQQSPTSFRLDIERTYEYSQERDLVRTTDTRWGETKYSYDPAERLLESHRQKGLSETFAYDPARNITLASRHDNGPGGPTLSSGPLPRIVGEQHRIIGPGNRMLGNKNVSYEYDAEGRMVKRLEGADGASRVWHYHWNALNQLRSITTPEGEVWHYKYDPFGRRISKQGPNCLSRYVWDRDTILHELSERSPPITWHFLPRTFEPVIKQQGRQVFYFLNDHLGTPRELVDGSGTVAWAGVLSAWGELERVSMSTDCPLRFQGQWHDPESGLYYNRFRYYSPELGAYISPDPLGIVGSLNEYAYGTNPVLWIDPLGLILASYGDLDNHGRPTEATALIEPSDVHPATCPGTEANQSDNMHIPGYEGGAHPYHHQKGHLIGRQLGGTGDDPRNLATMTSGTNSGPNGMTPYEAQIAAHVAAGNVVTLTVTPVYTDEGMIASSFKIHAVDAITGQVIVDAEVENGHYQNHAG